MRTVVLMATALLGGCQGESVGSIGSTMPVLSCLMSFLIPFRSSFRNGPKIDKQRVPNYDLAPKCCPEALLEPTMDLKMEPGCLRELPRGAPGSPNSPKMHPTGDAALASASSSSQGPAGFPNWNQNGSKMDRKGCQSMTLHLSAAQRPSWSPKWI